MNLQARRFAARVLLFFAPLLCAIFIAEALLWKTGETLPAAQVPLVQIKQPEMLWIRSYFNQAFAIYKWQGFKIRRPQILALGSSRVMKFRAPMFGKDGANFFNAGGLIENCDDLQAFAELLPASNASDPQGLRVALVGIDFWWFEGERDTQQNLFPNLAAPTKPDDIYLWQAHVQALRRLLKIYKARPLLELKQAAFEPQFPVALGVKARSSGNGFRFDGSERRGEKAPADKREWRKVWEKHEGGWRKRITKGTRQGTFAPNVSPRRLQQVRQAFTTLQNKGVQVLVFAPPIVSEYARLMDEMPEHHLFWSQYRSFLKQLCLELNLPYCDASTPQALGLQDIMMGDGVHAEETFHLSILRCWLKNPAVRRTLLDTSRAVEAALHAPRTNIWYPDFGTDVPDDRLQRAR